MKRALRAPIIAVVLATSLACGGGGGGSSGPKTSAEQATKLSGIGDSIMEGVDVSSFGTQHSLSFAQGTSASVDSLYSRYMAVSSLPGGQEFVSETGATMVDDALAQAVRICNQASKADRIVILLGANDACGGYGVADFGSALTAVLGKLASTADCGLPSGTRVHVLSVPRVDYLYAATSGKACEFPGPTIACSTVTGSSADRQQLADTIDGYNQAIADAVAAANTAFHHAEGDVTFSTDWTGTTPNSSIGTYQFAAGDVSSVDCFHPSAQGQKKLACAAWESWEGTGDASACF